MSASYCFVLPGRCIAPRVRDSIFAEHQRPQVAAFMECVDFMQPRWPSRISTFNPIFCRSFRIGTGESVGGYRTRLWFRKMLVESYQAPDSGTPGMQHAQETDLGSKMLRIACHLKHGFSAGP